ncbi:methyltransferase domain-containing protein [Sulfurivirga sp.]|uniref:methyltransferase domain-containing protein n=1 Tax=Sulfurivirga sp. TaxID=2614236 RepID=UPI0025E78E55|nr:methyltransferase domain-containing protein [Sulfurivirga sp.]
MPSLTDRNFDPLVEKFEQRIYGSFKGQLRLALLKEDLAPLRDGPPLTVWDAGCGLGQMSVWFAEAGHTLTACDISEKMLERTRAELDARGLRATLRHCPAQQLAAELPQQDLVLFHAVIEWLAHPLETLAQVADRVRPGGHLSLLFYNHHSLVYRNLLRGGWRLRYVLEEKWLGRGRKLTPPHPQKPEILRGWLKEHGFEPVTQTGIRVFHDYMPEEARAATDLAELEQVERKYCREPVFRDMGTYIHLLAKRV